MSRFLIGTIQFNYSFNGREVIASSNYLIFCIIKFRKKEISASGDIALCKLSAPLNVLCEILLQLV